MYKRQVCVCVCVCVCVRERERERDRDRERGYSRKLAVYMELNCTIQVQ